MPDRNKLYKHLKGSGAYSGTAKQNDWLLKKLKIAGLRTGGFTGDNEGLAYLHPNEVVLNDKETTNYFNFGKVMEKLTKTIGKVKSNGVSEQLSSSSSNSTATSYGDINITIQGGDRKKAKTIATEILDGIRKRGG